MSSVQYSGKKYATMRQTQATKVNDCTKQARIQQNDLTYAFVLCQLEVSFPISTFNISSLIIKQDTWLTADINTGDMSSDTGDF